MSIKPHKTKEQTWVIDYVRIEGGEMVSHEEEFKGSLRVALSQERKLSSLVQK